MEMENIIVGAVLLAMLGTFAIAIGRIAFQNRTCTEKDREYAKALIDQYCQTLAVTEPNDQDLVWATFSQDVTLYMRCIRRCSTRAVRRSTKSLLRLLLNYTATMCPTPSIAQLEEMWTMIQEKQAFQFAEESVQKERWEKAWRTIWQTFREDFQA